MNPCHILALPMEHNSAGADTIGDYLIRLLMQLWAEGDEFDPEQPFNKRHWQHEVYAALINNRVAVGKLYDDNGELHAELANKHHIDMQILTAMHTLTMARAA